jgi:hypothetical protein
MPCGSAAVARYDHLVYRSWAEPLPPRVRWSLVLGRALLVLVHIAAIFTIDRFLTDGALLAATKPASSEFMSLVRPYLNVAGHRLMLGVARLSGHDAP